MKEEIRAYERPRSERDVLVEARTTDGERWKGRQAGVHPRRWESEHHTEIRLSLGFLCRKRTTNDLPDPVHKMWRKTELNL